MLGGVEHDVLASIGRVASWERLVASSGAPVFYRSPFLGSIAAAPLLPVDSAHLLTISGPDGVTAAVPVFRYRRIDPLGLLAPLRDHLPDLESSSGLIGHCWHCYDSRLLAAEGKVDARPLVAALRQLASTVDADYFGLVNVSDAYTITTMAAEGIVARRTNERYVMDIARYESFQDYVDDLPPDSRRELRRQMRRFQETDGEVEVEVPPLRDLDEVVHMCRVTAARYDAAFYYPADETRMLMHEMGDAMRLVSVRCQGERVGVLVCFFDPPLFHVWAAGMVYGRTAFSPYTISMAEAIRYAISHGFRRVEGGRGNGRIKMKHGFVPQPLHACLERIDRDTHSDEICR